MTPEFYINKHRVEDRGWSRLIVKYNGVSYLTGMNVLSNHPAWLLSIYDESIPYHWAKDLILMPKNYYGGSELGHSAFAANLIKAIKKHYLYCRILGEEFTMDKFIS